MARQLRIVASGSRPRPEAVLRLGPGQSRRRGPGRRGALWLSFLTASTLRRQAAFVVLATINLDEPRPFLERLGEPDACVGDVMRVRRARGLIAAAFETRPEVGVSEADLPRLAEDAMKQTRLLVNNLRAVTYRDAYAIYSEALDGTERQAA